MASHHYNQSYNQPRYYAGGGGGAQTNVSAITSRAAEVAGRMGGVTPEIWDSVLTQMQQLVDENENLRKTLEANNYEMMEILEQKKGDVNDAHKLYWDARVSVLGFKAQIMKLNGELDDMRKQQDVSGTARKIEEETERLEQERKRQEINYSEVSQGFKHEIDDLKYKLERLHEKERQVTSECNLLKSENKQLRSSCEELKKSQQKTTPPVPRPRTNIIDGNSQKKISDLENSNKSLQEQLEKTKQELSRSRQEFDSLSRHAGEDQRRLNFDARQTSEQLHGMERRLQESQQELDDTKRELSDVFGQLRGKDRDIEYLKQQQQQLEDAKRQLNTKEREIDYLKQQQQQQLEDAKRQLNAKEREIDYLKQQQQQPSMATFDTSVAAGGGGAGGMQARLKKALNEEKGKSAMLVREVEDLKYQLQQQMDSQGSQKDFLESQVQTFEEEKEHLKTQLKELTKEKDQLRQRLDEVDQTAHDNYSVLEQNYATLKDDNAQLQVEHANLRDTLENEKERAYQLGVELSQANSKIEHLRNSTENENSSWEGYMEDVEKEMKRVTDELASFREKNRSLQSEVHQLTIQKTESETSKAKLMERLEKKDKDCQESIEQATLWKEQFDSARHDFEVQKKMRDKEATAVDALRSNRDSLQKEVNELRKRVMEQQSVIASIDPTAVVDLPPSSGGSSPQTERRHRSGEQERPKGGEVGFRPNTHGPRPPIREEFNPPYGRDPPGGYRQQDRGPNDDRKFKPQGGPPDDYRHGGPSGDRFNRPGPPDGRGAPPHGDSRFRQGGPPQDDQRFRQGGPPHDDQRFRQGGPPHDDQRFRQGGPSHDDQRFRQGGPSHDDQRFRQGGPSHDDRFRPGGHPSFDTRRPDERPFNPGGKGGQPYPYTDFTPLHPGGGGRGGGGGSGGGGSDRRGSGMNDLNAPRQQPGGGEHRSRDPVSTSPHLGGPPQRQPRPNQFPPPDHSGLTPVRRAMPPDVGGGGGAVPLPGEVPNTSKPLGNCPICGMGNFATQTDLELHAAKCDKFN